MKRVAFHTLGCKVNQYETEAIAELFKNSGYQVVDFTDSADVYVINTCTVTNIGEKKSGQIIRRARKNNKDAIIVVMGCYAQVAHQEASSISGVNIVIGTQNRQKIIELVEKFELDRRQIVDVGNIMTQREFEGIEIKAYRDRTRAFIKIQDGCDRFCSYCIVPYARGPVRSRKPDSITDEVVRLSQNGYKEIVLTGIHVASYGKDLGNIGLVDIILKIHEIKGIERIRLSSVEPLAINEEFLQRCKPLYKLCPHYHVSLQSGCDSTLKRMNRRYTAEQYRDVIKMLRNNINDVSITTDIIVGFPGETKQEFEQTYKFLEEMAFSKMHVFKYSPRKGTPAAKFAEQVSYSEKEERSNKLLELDLKNQYEFKKKFIGREMDVLLERQVKGRPELMEGLTPNYINVAVKAGKNLQATIQTVKLANVECDYIIGEIIL